jgi:hypothetical protein
MALPTLDELKHMLKEKSEPRTYKPSTIWTRTEALAMKPKTAMFVELERIRKNLSVKKKSLKEMKLFFKRYANKGPFIADKLIHKRRVLVARDLYDTMQHVKGCQDIQNFVADINGILKESRETWGRILYLWRSIALFSDRMGDLDHFLDQHTQSGGDFLESASYEIGELKKAMVRVYVFMRRRGID